MLSKNLKLGHHPCANTIELNRNVHKNTLPYRGLRDGSARKVSAAQEGGAELRSPAPTDMPGMV